jgi:hypothetical protein
MELSSLTDDILAIILYHLPFNDRSLDCKVSKQWCAVLQRITLSTRYIQRKDSIEVGDIHYYLLTNQQDLSLYLAYKSRNKQLIDLMIFKGETSYRACLELACLYKDEYMIRTILYTRYPTNVDSYDSDVNDIKSYCYKTGDKTLFSVYKHKRKEWKKQSAFTIMNFLINACANDLKTLKPLYKKYHDLDMFDNAYDIDDDIYDHNEILFAMIFMAYIHNKQDIVDYLMIDWNHHYASMECMMIDIPYLIYQSNYFHRFNDFKLINNVSFRTTRWHYHWKLKLTQALVDNDMDYLKSLIVDDMALHIKSMLLYISCMYDHFEFIELVLTTGIDQCSTCYNKKHKTLKVYDY